MGERLPGSHFLTNRPNRRSLDRGTFQMIGWVSMSMGMWGCIPSGQF